MNQPTEKHSDKPNTTTSIPASTLLHWLQILLLIALGVHLHRTQGNDGIVGIIVGACLVALPIVNARTPAESRTPAGRFIVAHRRWVFAIGVLVIILGALDTAGAL